jgi:glucosyl-3-phosphoglycerate synthase
VRAFRSADFDPRRLTALKRGRRVSVCLPARNEEGTVGGIVARIVTLGPLVDEVVVVDDGSTDGTARVARRAGARVVRAADVLPAYGTGPGKGEALWKGLAETDGELVAFCDADLRNFDAGFVTGLLGPLLETDDVCFVKALYERHLGNHPNEGGRVTELTARPALELLFPDLATVGQPLGGEYAGRRTALERVPFVAGYGVDLGLLIDMAARSGPAAIAQVDLGVRSHRNRPLAELGGPARAILEVALSRAGVTGLAVAQCPPLVDVPGYAARACAPPVRDV